MSDTRTCTLTVEQCEAIGERIECLLDDTEDWQLPEDEFNEAIRFWIGILNELEVEHPWADRYGVD